MLNSWRVGSKFWRSFMKSTPEEPPLKHLWIDLFLGARNSVKEGHRETNLLLNHMIQRSHFNFTETFPAKLYQPVRRGSTLLHAEINSSCEIVSKGVSQLFIVRKAGHPKSEPNSVQIENQYSDPHWKISDVIELCHLVGQVENQSDVTSDKLYRVKKSFWSPGQKRRVKSAKIPFQIYIE